MSFTWPEIPFTGAEVEAFVIAYKELAESIYSDYQNLSAPIEDISFLYKNENNMKEFLTNALLYSAFIVKQRSGNAGDGTDFDLSNSPLELPLTDAQAEKIFKNLGCTYITAAILCSWNKNKERDPSLGEFDDLMDNFLNDVVHDLSPDCEDFEDKVTKWNPYPSLSPWWRRFLDFASGTIGEVGGSFSGVSAAAKGLQRYAYGSGKPFTKTDLTNSQLNDLKRVTQNKIDQGKGTDRTNEKTDEQKSRLGAGPNDKIYTVDFVGTTWTNFLGNATVITDDQNNVKFVKDDFDFNYGWAINRSDGSQPGQPFSDGMIEDGSGWTDQLTTPCEAIEIGGGGGNGPFGNFIRGVPAQLHGQGTKGSWSGPNSGKPFTVDIDLQ